MGNERQFKGIWIPKDIWINKNLNLQEKCFLAEINSLDNEKEGCFALNEHFASFFNLSKNRCSEVIKSLQEKEYIDIDYKYKGKQIIERRIKMKDKFFIPSISRQTSSTSRLDTSISRQTPSENWVDRITIENNNIDYIDEPKFIPPTLEEIEAYCKERNNNVDAIRFINHYQSNGWKVGKTKMKDWKACVRTWERNNYQTKPNAKPKSNEPTIRYKTFDEWLGEMNGN